MDAVALPDHGASLGKLAVPAVWEQGKGEQLELSALLQLGEADRRNTLGKRLLPEAMALEPVLGWRICAMLLNEVSAAELVDWLNDARGPALGAAISKARARLSE